jgi:hypothetical protein
MCMSDGFVDAHGLGDLGRRPFSLVYVEVEEDPTSRRILQRGDGSVDLGEWFITHAGSLSTANADGRAQGENLASLDGSASSLDFEQADRIGEFWGYPESRAFAELLIDLEEARRHGRSCSGCRGRWSGSSAYPPTAGGDVAQRASFSSLWASGCR